mmetsp:Transcript_34738/g.75503  ORF Transcript_34738/g.75503 Transcript_34738/m.75503 type:complete len:219 (-) Transcript_34738:825-1481(-)
MHQREAIIGHRSEHNIPVGPELDSGMLKGKAPGSDCGKDHLLVAPKVFGGVTQRGPPELHGREHHLLAIPHGLGSEHEGVAPSIHGGEDDLPVALQCLRSTAQRTAVGLYSCQRKALVRQEGRSGPCKGIAIKSHGSKHKLLVAPEQRRRIAESGSIHLHHSQDELPIPLKLLGGVGQHRMLLRCRKRHWIQGRLRRLCGLLGVFFARASLHVAAHCN